MYSRKKWWLNRHWNSQALSKSCTKGQSPVFTRQVTRANFRRVFADKVFVESLLSDKQLLGQQCVER